MPVTVQFQLSICSRSVFSRQISRHIFNSWSILFFFFIQGIPNITFFFSAISTQEKKKACIIEETTGESSLSEEDEDLSQIPSATTEQWLDGSLASVNKSLSPAISYWVALTTRNGAPASPISVHKAVLNCEVDVTAQQVSLFSP